MIKQHKKTACIITLSIVATTTLLSMAPEPAPIKSVKADATTENHLALATTLEQCHGLLALARTYQQEKKACDKHAALFNATLGGKEYIAYAAEHIPTSAAAKSAFLRYANLLGRIYLTHCEILPNPAEIQALAKFKDPEMQLLAKQVALQTIALTHNNNCIGLLSPMSAYLPRKKLLAELIAHPKIPLSLTKILKLCLTPLEQVEFIYSTQRDLANNQAAPKITRMFERIQEMLNIADHTLEPLATKKISMAETSALELIEKARSTSIAQLEQELPLLFEAQKELIAIEREKEENNNLSDKQIIILATQKIKALCENLIYFTKMPYYPFKTFIEQLSRPAEDYFASKALMRSAFTCQQSLISDKTPQKGSFTTPIFLVCAVSPEIMSTLEKQAAAYEEELCGAPSLPTQKKHKKLTTAIDKHATTAAASTEEIAQDCLEEISAEELMRHFGKRTTAPTEAIDEINLPTNPYLPHSDGSKLISINTYAISIDDPQGFTIRLYRTDEHEAQPIHTSYHPRIYRWFTQPETELKEHLTKGKIPAGVSTKEAIFNHAFGRRVDSFAPIECVQTRWPGQKENTTILSVLGEIESPDKKISTGAFIWAYDNKTGVCFHRGFTQQPWDNLVKSRIQDGYQLLHTKDIDDE